MLPRSQSLFALLGLQSVSLGSQPSLLFTGLKEKNKSAQEHREKGLE